MIRYPYSRPYVTEDDLRCLTDTANGQFLTQGPRVVEFERALSEAFGADHAIVCNSGTAALHMIYHGLGLGPDKGLITSPLTFLATASAARMCDAPVAFCDVDRDTGLMTPETLEQAFTQVSFPVGVVAPVHLGGRVADLSGLAEVAKAHGAVLVDDACHAPGAFYVSGDAHQRVGDGFAAHASSFSFHAIKHLTMGEGGAILTNDADLAKSAKVFRGHGMVRDPSGWESPPEPDAPWYYEMHEVGYNYHASELSCALGLSQLARLSEGLRFRRALVDVYSELLSDIPHVTLPTVPQDPNEHAWHLYAVAVDFEAAGKSRGTVMRALMEAGIGTQVHYIPLYRQPFFGCKGFDRYPGAEHYYSRTLSIPLHLGIAAEDAREIADALRRVLTE